jgi:hypothetical protein
VSETLATSKKEDREMKRSDYTDKVALDLILKGPAKEAKRPTTGTLEDADANLFDSMRKMKAVPATGGMQKK